MEPLILVAEADPYVSRLFSSYLSPAGYRVIQAADPHTAWQIIMEQSPSAVLLGAELSGLDSSRLLSSIRSHRKFANMPVILLGSPRTMDEIVHWFRLGIDGYVDEPCSPHLLLAQINALLRREQVGKVDITEKRHS